MFPNRLLTYLNYFSAALLAVAIALAVWFVWMPLPQTSGTIEVPIAAEVDVDRDHLGVPHITAQTLEDAMFVQGYVTAQDRLWQMEALRRYAAGELSEIIGAGTINVDREQRQMRLARLAEAEVPKLNASDRAAFSAYARGVNHFIETHRNHLPIEFTILQCEPRPWRIADSLETGMLLYQSLTSSTETELRKAEMLAVGDAKLVNLLYPLHGGSDFQPGSNGWVLSGARTVTGKPILANDPHLEHSMPSRWYMVHIKANGFEVSGVSLPGMPGVIIGHNGRIAWGITNLHFDVQDYVKQQIDTQTGRYLYKGQVEQARLEREVIRVKNHQSVEVLRWVTRYGPVLEAQGVGSLALHWVANEPGGIHFPILDIDRAKNWQEFRAALASFPGPGSNFLYADVDGNIGWQVAGKLPIRGAARGDVPANGTDGSADWNGFMPFDQLPMTYNPASGMIVTANQNPFPANYIYPVNGAFAPGYRAGQIKALLSRKEKWSVPEMITIQKDVYSPYLMFLAKAMVGSYRERRPRDARMEDAIAELRNWNGQVDKDASAPLIAHLLSQYLIKAIADRAAPGKGALYVSTMSPAVVESVLRGRSNEWFSDYGQLLMECFTDAVDEGSRLQGKKPSEWRWGKYYELTLENPVVGKIPYVGKWFNIGPIPLSGAGTTVKQTSLKLMPSMRFVADLSDWDHSLQNITVGESGQILSSHYRDQWESFYTGQSYRMPFHQVDSSSRLVFKPQ